MNIVFINGSPKGSKSCSKYLLDTVKESILGEINGYDIDIADNKIKEEDKFRIIAEADKIVIACPLYVDCLPSTVIKFLESFEEYVKKNNITKEATLYGMVNCGFFEGNQNRQALKVLKNFTAHIPNMKYGGGIGVGGGAFIGGSRSIPWEAKIKVNVKKALEKLADVVWNGDLFGKDIFVNINFNKRLYMLVADLSWIRSGFKNKVSIGKLNKKQY